MATVGEDRAMERLRGLQAITDAALARLAQADLLDELLDRVRSVLGADTAAVLLLDEEANEVVIRAAKGLEEEVEAGVRIPVGRGFAGRVAAERRPVFLPEVTADRVVNPILLEKGVRSLLGVPLLVEGRVLGVLHVGTLTPRDFTEDDAELLQLAADRIALAIEHLSLYESEREARADAEHVAKRIRQLQSVTDVALGHLAHPDELMVRVLERVRDVLSADTAAILLLEGGELVARAAKGIEEEVETGVRVPLGRGFAGRIAAGRRPIVLPTVDHADVHNPILVEKGIRSLLGVPLLVEGRVIGVMHVGTHTPREFTEDDVALLELAGDRIALAIDRARQRGVARTLQQSLLPPRLPDVAGLEMAARYAPGVDEAHVGGDWYDVLRLPRGKVGVVMGDVVSRGLRAATLMGQLRTALRAYALDGSSPAAVLGRMNDLIRTWDSPEMATVAYIVLAPDTGEMTYSVAGHPPPLVVGAARGGRFLEEGRGGPVGVTSGVRFPEAQEQLDDGETLLLYTDGLVESREASIDEGLGALRDEAAEIDGWPDRMCDQLMTRFGGAPDDVALLAVRRSAGAGLPLELQVRATPDSLSAMRRSLAAWLAAAGADEDESYDMVVAVGEAAANAVEHAYGPVDAKFDVLAEAEGGEVHIKVADHGRWRPARGRNRGRGMDVMSKLMDDVQVDRGEHGTTVTMRRRLGGGTVR
jgi:GAF domain-containing protein/anti-sigma regulatory factor (Ser/Thr protein kinase)